MWELLAWFGLGVAVLGVCWLCAWLIKESQADDRSCQNKDHWPGAGDHW